MLSYVNAHTEDFDRAGKVEDDFEIPKNMAEFPCKIVLQRYSTSCLQPFLGNQQIWVFHDQNVSVQSPLYLSASIEEFADIWGPVWRVEDEKNLSVLRHYDVGNGLLVLWEYDPMLHPMLATNEQLCHWIAKESPWEVLSDEPGSHAEQEASTSPSLVVYPDRRLLIGARQHRKHIVWSACRCDIKKIEEKLLGLHRLQHLGTSRSYNYMDSRSVSLAFGSNGVTAGATLAFKRVRGVYSKETFINLWEKEPSMRHPRYLANLWGVAISFCTLNAERVSIFQLLDAPSMRRFLEKYTWSETSCRNEFLQAIETGEPEGLRALCNLWRDNSEELGRVLLSCFRLLSCTGLDTDRQEFAALWIPPDTFLAKRVLFKPSEHSWMKFLPDSEESFTVAVMYEECLDAKFGGRRRRCGVQEVPSALQTSICVNEEIEPSQQLVLCRATTQACDARKWDRQWDVSQLPTGACFPLGAQGRLKTIEVLTRTRLLLEWDIIWRKVILETIGIQRRPPPSHWEYTEPYDCTVRPIPIYLRSSDE